MIENNWLFSQFISFAAANEIFVNVTYMFETGDYVTLHGQGSSGILETTPRTDTSNYKPLIRGNEEASRLLQTSSSSDEVKLLSFVRPEPKTTGFYLGIQEQGIFGTFKRIIIFYNVVRERTDGLLTCPEIPLPAVGAAPSTGVCTCAAKSKPQDGVSLEMTCDSDGSCNSGQWCACLPGYQLDSNTCKGIYICM